MQITFGKLKENWNLVHKDPTNVESRKSQYMHYYLCKQRDYYYDSNTSHVEKEQPSRDAKTQPL